MQDRYLTSKEAAEYMGVSARTIQAWRTAGIGPRHYTLSPHTIRYTHEMLDAWVDEQTHAAEQRQEGTADGHGTDSAQ